MRTVAARRGGNVGDVRLASLLRGLPSGDPVANGADAVGHLLVQPVTKDGRDVGDRRWQQVP
jgi:hypothetical protein